MFAEHSNDAPHIDAFACQVMSCYDCSADVGLISVVSMLIVVVFPAPLGPRNPNISPPH